MLRILILLWGIGFNGVAADTMKGGQEPGADTPLDTALIQKGTATICLGAIFNSFTVLTSAMCSIDKKTPSEYSIVPAWMTAIKNSSNPDQNSTAVKRLPVTSIDVANGDTVGTPAPNDKNPFRALILRVMIPGWLMGPEASAALFLNEWDVWLETVKKNRTNPGTVLSYGPPVKQAAINNANVDSEQCNTTYNTMTKPAEWPKYMPFETFCVFPGTEAFDSSFNPSVAPGTACEDSIGSPVYARYGLLPDPEQVLLPNMTTTTVSPGKAVRVIGILLWVQCSPSPFAIGIASPEFLAEQPIYTDEPGPTADIIPRTRNPTRHRPSPPPSPFPVPTRPPHRRDPKSSEPNIRPTFLVRCAMILLGSAL